MTLADIHLKLQQIESDKEGTGTVHLNNAITEVDVVAKRAFAPLLERQVQTHALHFINLLATMLQATCFLLCDSHGCHGPAYSFWLKLISIKIIFKPMLLLLARVVFQDCRQKSPVDMEFLSFHVIKLLEYNGRLKWSGSGLCKECSNDLELFSTCLV